MLSSMPGENSGCIRTRLLLVAEAPLRERSVPQRFISPKSGSEARGSPSARVVDAGAANRPPRDKPLKSATESLAKGGTAAH
jgi:hypothetical protein